MLASLAVLSTEYEVLSNDSAVEVASVLSPQSSVLPIVASVLSTQYAVLVGRRPV
jgi:hypothetical protein